MLTPKTPNLDIPNEDARSVDLEDSNLFALNRFPGYDRWEDASRVTYGARLDVRAPELVDRQRPSAKAIGSVSGSRFSRTAPGLPGAFPISSGGPGCATAASSTSPTASASTRTIFAVRRNEIDLTVGTEPDLCPDRLSQAQPQHRSGDRGFARQGGVARSPARILFARYWSVFGATVIDLTDSREDPLSLADGYEPVRDRLGIAI